MLHNEARKLLIQALERSHNVREVARNYNVTAENMTVVRRIALSALKLHPAKMSLARKKRHCSYDDEILAQVLELIHA